MHFSRPSGHLLSWCLPWNRGAVGRLTSGYSTVSTLRNICLKVTAKPLTGFRKSSTGDLLYSLVLGALTWQPRRARGQAVVVRQIHRRHGEHAGAFLRRLGFHGRAPLRRALGRVVPGEGQREQDEHDPAADYVDASAAAVPAPDAERGDQQRPCQRSRDKDLPAEPHELVVSDARQRSA